MTFEIMTIVFIYAGWENFKFNYFNKKILIYLSIFEIIYIVISMILKFIANFKYNKITKWFIILNPFIYFIFAILCFFYGNGMYLVFLFLSFIFNILYSLTFIPQCCNCNCSKKKKVIIIKLIRYQNYKINDYILPSKFELMAIRDKINCLSFCEKYFEFSLNNEQIQLIELINEFRKKYKIGILGYKKNEKLKYFFSVIKHIKHTSFDAFETFFELSKNNYLFIYPIGEFKEHFIKKDENINQILLKDYLNYILIMESENKEYILIYQSYFTENHDLHPPLEMQNTYIESNDELKINKK